MKYLKLFESNYNNQKLTAPSFSDLKKEVLPFTKLELERLYTYFSQYRCEEIFYSNQQRIPISNLGWRVGQEFSEGYPPLFRVENISSRWVTIFKLEDNWYLVFDWTLSYFSYWKMDDLEGLFSYFDELKLRKI